MSDLTLSVLFSSIISLLRSIYFQNQLIDVILEVLLCSLLTVIALSVLTYSGYSEDLTIPIGGFVGFLGVKKLSIWIDKLILKN